MASFHFNHRRQNQSFMSNIGSKVKQAAEIAGTLKGLYDVGKMLYTGIRTVGPTVAAVGALL